MDSILEVNISKIIKKKQYLESTGIRPKYCIINNKTLNLLKSNNVEQNYASDYVSRIYGLKTAICDELKFGEFDVK